MRPYRPHLILFILVTLSLVSLATGTEATIVHRFVIRVVDFTAYPFLETRAKLARSVDYVLDWAFTYDKLREENSVLERDIAQLSTALVQRRELYDENRRLRVAMGFEADHPELILQPMKVIESLKGMLTLDGGTRMGIRPNLCVVTSEGVVGIVIEVADFSCKVATLHHPDCKVGAMVQRQRLRAYDGVVHADETFRLICNMFYIDMKEDVRVGDRVVTSPESLFPSGLPIGRIDSVHSGDGLLKYADIVPYVDPYRLDEVFVILAAPLRQDDLAGPPLEKTPPDHKLAAVRDLAEARELPDPRPIQEQLAP